MVPLSTSTVHTLWGGGGGVLIVEIRCISTILCEATKTTSTSFGLHLKYVLQMLMFCPSFLLTLLLHSLDRILLHRKTSWPS